MSTNKVQKIKNILRNWTAFVPFLILLVVLWAIANTTFKKDYKSGIIEADAKGYYAYLPAVFIYHDLNFGFYNQIERNTYYDPNLYYEYLRNHNGKTINKYYVGTSLCLLPFFLVGHLFTLTTDLPVDGYSYYYTLMVHLGALFYLLLGLCGVRKFLRTYQINEIVIALTLISIVFGTNLFYYVVSEFGMSHLYSFTAITWVGFVIRKYFSGHKSIYLIYCALLLGIIALIRPINLLVVLAIPFLAGSYEQMISGIKNIYSKKLTLLIAVIGFMALVSIQLIIYKISTGDFFLYSYQQEGFKFLDPNIWNFLFSYRKGMFVYTPILLISLLGFVFIYQKNRFQFYTLLGFFLVLIYVFSSWHMWFYGGSFSQRVMIDFYAFFAILLSIAIQNINFSFAKKLYVSVLFLLVIFCQIQTYQYRRMQIHWSDMNKEKYWNVFMRVDKL